MSEAVLFVGTYRIPAGGADAFYAQSAAMTEFIRDHEPRVIAIGHYVNEDQTEGTTIHLHPDGISFDFHMQAASRVIGQGAQTVEVKRIEFFGKPSDRVLEGLSDAFEVSVKTWAGGFSRITTD